MTTPVDINLVAKNARTQMPTPIEILLDPISLIVLGMFAALLLWETLAPGRELPQIRGWKVRGLIAFGVFFYLSSYLPLVWDQYLARSQLFDLAGLGTALGTVIGLLVYETGAWVWHWSMHKSNLLWRVFHQMHHSAERLDSYGALYFSPLDMIGWTFLASLCLVLVVGVTAQAATNILLITMFMTFFQHANVKTPIWLGYIIQRPESHTVHHGRDVHAYNYSDLPLIDMIFGTFRNPCCYDIETGFYDGASARVSEMLLFQDVSEPKREESAGRERVLSGR